MNQKDKRQVETELVKMGLSGIDDPDLLAVFAATIEQFPGDKHWFLQGIINECEPAKRYEMYHALSGKFQKFKPLPLATYEARIAEQAGSMVSQRRMRVSGDKPKPIEIGGGQYVEVPRPLSTQVVATLTCYKCRKCERFLGDTAAGAMIAARKAGWIREPGVNKEQCAECTAALTGESQVVALSKREHLVVTDKRQFN